MIRVPLAKGEEKSRWQIFSSGCCTTFPVFFIIMETAFGLGLILLLYSAAMVPARPNTGARSAEDETNFETMVRFLVKKLNSNEHLLQLMEHKFDKMSGNIKIHALLLQRLKNELKSYRARRQKLSGNITTKDNTQYSDVANKRRVLHRARRQAAYSFLSPEILETLAQEERIGVNDTPMVFASGPPPLFHQEMIFEGALNVQSTPEENLGETTETITVSTAPPSTSTAAELKPKPHHNGGIKPTGAQSQGQSQPQLQPQPQQQQPQQQQPQQQPPQQQPQQQQQQPQQQPQPQQQQQQQQQYLGSDYLALPQLKSTPQPGGVPKEADEEYEAGESDPWSKSNKSEKGSASGHQVEPDEIEHGTKKGSGRDTEADEHHKTRFDSHPRVFKDQHGNKRNFKSPQQKESDYEASDKEERAFVRSSEYENSETSGLSRKRRFQPMAIRAHDPRVDYTPEMNYPLQPDKAQEAEENQPTEIGKSSNAGIVWISKDSRKELGTIEPETKPGQQNSQDNLTIFQRIDGSSQDYPGNKEAGSTHNQQETEESKTPQSENGEQPGQEPQGQQEADTADTKGSNPQNQPETEDHKSPYLYPGIDEHGIPHSYPGVDEHGIPHLYPGIDEHGIPHLYSGIDGYGIPYGGQVGEEYGTHLLPIEEVNSHKHNVPPGVQNGMIDKNRYEGMYPGDSFLNTPYGAENYLDFPLDGETNHMHIPEEEEKKDGSDESSDEDTKGAALSHSSKYGGIRHMERLRSGDIISSAERPTFNMDLYPAESNTFADNSAQGDKDSEESGEAPSNNARSYHGDYHDPVNNQLFMFNKEYPDKNSLLHKIKMAANQRNPIYPGIDQEDSQNTDKHNVNYGRPNHNINQRHESNPNRYMPNSNKQRFNRDFRRRNFDAMSRGLHDTTPNRFGHGMISDHSSYDKNFDRLNYESRLFGKPLYNTNQKGYYHSQSRGYNNNNPFTSNYNNQPNYNMGLRRSRHMAQSNGRQNLHSVQRMHNIPFGRYNTKSGYNADNSYNNNNQYYDIGRSNRAESSYTSHGRGTAHPASDEQDEVFGTDRYYNNDSGEVKDERKNNNNNNNINNKNNTHHDSAERRNSNYFMY